MSLSTTRMCVGCSSTRDLRVISLPLYILHTTSRQSLSSSSKTTPASSLQKTIWVRYEIYCSWLQESNLLLNLLTLEPIFLQCFDLLRTWSRSVEADQNVAHVSKFRSKVSKFTISMVLNSKSEGHQQTLCLAYISRLKPTKVFVWQYNNKRQTLRYRVHYATKVFDARTLHNKRFSTQRS